MTNNHDPIATMILRTFLLLLLAGAMAHAQDATVYPDVLYSDVNELTVTAPEGIRSITVIGSDPALITDIEGDGEASCQKERTIRLKVHTASQPVAVNVEVVDCRGARTYVTLGLETVWTLDRIPFGTARQDSLICREFQVRSTGDGDIWLDDVTVADPRASLRMPTSLPHLIPGGTTYRYTVCYRAEEIGTFLVPVITWIRRAQPSAGRTNYPVADTGFINVIPPVIDPLRDPTTFRSVGIPNAVVPRRGTLYLGSYDLLGLTAGYSLDDRLMVIAAAALPTPDDWAGIHNEIFGAWSIGLKLGLHPDSLLHLAAGYQFGSSFFDRQSSPLRESQISVHAPWIAASYGDDDARASLTIGYAFKRHRTLLEFGFIDEFDRNAWFTALGADYRLARHWKVAAEAAYLQTSGVLPVIAVVRYFTRRFAVEAGLAYVGISLDDAQPPAVPLLPVLTGVVVF